MPLRSRVALFMVLFLLVATIVWLSFFSGSVSNVSALKPSSNLGVYWNPNCSDAVSSIDWEHLTPGSNKSVVVYVRNEMKESVTLSLETQNWSPSNASVYLFLSWDYDGSSIDCDEVCQVVVSLFVSPDIQGITFFSFDIIVASTPTRARVVQITDPTTLLPIYTQSGTTLTINYTYTEFNPNNATIKIRNATCIVGEIIVTDLVPGVDVTRSDIVNIAAWAEDGEYNVTVTIYGVADQTATDTQTNAVIIDNTPPVKTVVSPPSGSYLDFSSTWINETLSDTTSGIDPATVTMTVDGTPVTSNYDSTTGLLSYYVAGLADGNYTVVVGARDLAGNLAINSWWFFIDTTFPTVTIKHAPGSSFIYLTAEDVPPASGVFTIYVRIDSGSWEEHQGSGSVEIELIGTDSHSIEAYSKDNAGNESPLTNLTVHYLIVNTDPLGLDAPAGEGWFDEGTDAPFNVDTVPNYDFNYWYLDGQLDIPYSTNMSTSVTMDTPHTATAKFKPEWPITYAFEDIISAKEDSSQHQFEVPSGTSRVEVWLEMPSGADFDLSLWDDLDRRTGGWTSGDHKTRTNIPNSQYSGYLAEPEWIIVEPPATTKTWKVGCYSFSGSGTYKITVQLYGPPPPDFSVSADPDILTFGKPLSGSTSYDSMITVASLNDFRSTVMLSGSWVGTVPTGVGYYFDPESITPPPNSYETSTLTVTVDSTVSTGTFTLRVTGTNNSISHHVDVKITVTPAGPEYVFEGSISTSEDSSLHIFAVPAGTSRAEVWLEMPSGADFDLSLWDDLDRRTGGWTSGDHKTRTNIPNSQYSGFIASPEWIVVEPPATSETWKVGCYSFSGSGTYKITVTLVF